jgi:hypothetical protein
MPDNRLSSDIGGEHCKFCCDSMAAATAAAMCALRAVYAESDVGRVREGLLEYKSPGLDNEDKDELFVSDMWTALSRFHCSLGDELVSFLLKGFISRLRNSENDKWIGFVEQDTLYVYSS